MDEQAAGWQRLGLYDPGSRAAEDRLATLRFLAERGATDGDLVQALADGALAELGTELRLRRPRLTARTVAERADVPLETVLVILRAAGLGDIEPDMPGLLDSDVRTVQLGAAGIELFGEEATLQTTRVLGAALAGVADAAMTNFGQNVQPGLDAGPTSELARAQAFDGATSLLLDGIPTLLSDVFFHFAEAALRQSAVSGAATTSELTVGFLDLVGSTALGERLEPAKLGAVISEFERVATERVAARDGRLVKTIGDEVMFVATDAGAACTVALELVRFVEDDPVLPQLRGALAAGGLIRGYGDFYGPVVTTAARSVKLAAPGTVLVTAEVCRRAGVADVAFDPAGAHQLRGLEQPVELFRLRAS